MSQSTRRGQKWVDLSISEGLTDSYFIRTGRKFMKTASPLKNRVYRMQTQEKNSVLGSTTKGLMTTGWASAFFTSLLWPRNIECCVCVIWAHKRRESCHSFVNQFPTWWLLPMRQLVFQRWCFVWDAKALCQRWSLLSSGPWVDRGDSFLLWLFHWL